jgi:hypothetical protein
VIREERASLWDLGESLLMEGKAVSPPGDTVTELLLTDHNSKSAEGKECRKMSRCIRSESRA